MKLYSALIVATATLAIYLDWVDSAWFQLLKPVTTTMIIGILLGFGASMRSRFNQLMVSALIFCLIGDIFLLFEEGFVAGLASFLIAHLIFACAFVNRQNSVSTKPQLGLPIITFGVLYLWYLWPHLEAMKLPVSLYVIAIIFMSWQALALHHSTRKFPTLLMAAGALLFMTSDSIIAYSRFVGDFRGSGILILALYWLAIFLMTRSAYLLTTGSDYEGDPLK